MNAHAKAVERPSFDRLVANIVAQNSISASDASWDHSNTAVIEIQERWFRSIGFHTIVKDASSIDQAHQSNEFLHENQIGPMASVLHNLTRRYCIDLPKASSRRWRLIKNG